MMRKDTEHTSAHDRKYEVAPFEQNEGSAGNKRIVFIGASYKFVHKVLRDMLLVGGFNNCELVVHDIDETPLNLVADLLERIVTQKNSSIKISRTLDRKEALNGADAAILSITTGGLESDTRSWEVCAKYNIPVGVGDTLGPSALMRNLRAIPIVTGIIKDMEELCPDAVMLNFSNPMSCLTAAMARRNSIPTWGLCHSADELYSYFAKVFNCGKNDLKMEIGGVNHQSFMTRLWVRNEERTKNILKTTLDSEAKLEDNLLDTMQEDVDLQQEIFSILGAWPSTGDTHLAEFYRFYFTPGRINRFSGHIREIVARREPYGRRECPAIIEQWTNGTGPVEDLHLLTTEHAHELLWSIFTEQPYTRVLNIINTAPFINGIAKNACVEAEVTITGKNVIGKTITLPPAIHSLVQRWTTIYDLSIKAAMDCDRDALKQALFLDPHIRDPRDIDPMIDDFIKILDPWLPNGWHNS